MVSAAQGRELGAHVHLQMLEEVVVLQQKKGGVRERGKQRGEQRGEQPAPARHALPTSCDVNGTSMPMPPDRVV